MKKTLILVAGPPATGKSYLIEKMRKTLPDFFFISPDEIKELYAEKFGFNNLQEKEQLETEVWKFYYDMLEKYMWIGKQIIVTEYPFSDKQKMKFELLSNQYQYNIITVRLVADFEILWQRRHKRDLDASRHLSHIMQSYHFGDKLEERSLASNHITKEGFKKIILDRKYNYFSLGDLFEIDVTDYSKIDYPTLINKLMKKIVD